MKYLVAIYVTLVFCCWWTIANAAEAITPDPGPVSNDEFIGALMTSLGGMKGAGALAIAGMVVQLLMKFLYTPWAGEYLKDASGMMKLNLVSGLTLVAGVIAMMTPAGGGLTLGAALIHATTLSAIMVFGHQIWKQYTAKPAEPPAIKPA
jgi:hypothetical protein